MYNNDNQGYYNIIYKNKDIIENKNKNLEEYKTQNIKENNIDKDKNFFRESLINIEKKIYFDNNLEFHNNEIRQNEQMKSEKEKTKNKSSNQSFNNKLNYIINYNNLGKNIMIKNNYNNHINNDNIFSENDYTRKNLKKLFQFFQEQLNTRNNIKNDIFLNNNIKDNNTHLKNNIKNNNIFVKEQDCNNPINNIFINNNSSSIKINN